MSLIAPQATGIASHELDTPCLLLDVDRLERNVERMAQLARAAGVKLRPHAKTHKLIEVAERQLAAGAAGLTVAKLGEAELFAGAPRPADNGVPDLLIAFPLWGPAKWERLCRLAARARVRVAADSFEVCAGISGVASRHGLTIPVLIEVDTGLARCGVPTVAAARSLAERLSRLPGVELIGVMSFAGHSYHAGPVRRSQIAAADAAQLLEVAAALREQGFPITEVSAGSTPLAANLAELEGVTEYRPGTYVFSDRDQTALGWGTLEDCALTAVATIVSRPAPGRAVIDAGTKTLSSDPASNAAGCGAISGHPDWRLATLYEEHGLIDLPTGDDPPIGTVVEVIPNHACGALNLHDWVAVSRDTVVLDWWPVLGRGLVR